MDREGILISERIKEVSMICARENPIYEQVSSYGIALYVLGCFNVPDVMSIDDIDSVQAGDILKENFTPVRESDLPSEYKITESDERYLLVIGDPLFPIHFAVLTHANGNRTYFSKLRYFGSGYDTIEELIHEFSGEEGIGYKDIHFFKRTESKIKKSGKKPRIYICRKDGSVV
ncbi:MAG: hypothetical protein JW944_05790 [Deltaproteobacteria bacterium]|nr:hypothetical protein [Deltaproteobacteria bacterium]